MHLPTVPNDFRPAKSPYYNLMNIQLTKRFNKDIEIYGGCKNLLNFVPQNPLFKPEDPFGPEFDTTYNYAPIQGIKGFLGIRYTVK
ncbi:TonB dependent receptor [compost metagenome]